MSSKGSSSSARETRVQLEGDIAYLRGKLALAKEKQERELVHRAKMDEVRRKKMEIIREEERNKEYLKTLEENFRMKEELIEREARMIASIKHEKEGDHILSDPLAKPLAEMSSNELLERFLSDQSASVSDVHVSTSNRPTVIADSCAPVPTPEEKVAATSAAWPSSLNPFSPPFEPIYTFANTTITNPFSGIPISATPTGVAQEQAKRHSPETTTTPSEETLQSKLLEVAKLLAETQNQSRLPVPEPGIFSGDLLQYPFWVKAFDTLIEGRAVKPTEKLHFLGKYVRGEAKELVDSFLLLDSEDAYDKAKEMLRKRYGDPFAVATTCRKKLESWPRIYPSDSASLRKYADFLVQCEKMMEKIGSLQVLNDDQENRKLTSKLPRWASNRWSRFAFHWKEDNGTFPPFSEFVKFVVKEADIACDPVLSGLPSLVLNEEDKEKSSFKGNRTTKPPRRRPQGATTLATNSSKETQGAYLVNRKPAVIIKSCFACKKPHDLDTCPEFLKRTISERRDFALNKGLCFACLQHGHLSKDCTERKTCDICGRRHPTPFHGDIRKSDKDTSNNNPDKIPTANNPATCHMIGRSKSQFNSMIVPVWLSHRSNPSNKRLVYALLDDQSDTTFVGDDTLRHLGISGPETNLLLSTMHSTDKLIKAKRIEGLIAQDFDHKVTMQLPKAYSRGIIPARRTQIPRPEHALQWPHLANIANQIAPYHDDVEIGILIGSDCPRAIMPRQIIPGDDDKTYAMRSDLGWGIVGRISQHCDEEDNEEDRIGVSHRIYTREVWEADVANPNKTCNFAVKTHVKEVINPFRVIKMFEMDFSERQANRQAALSQDDLKFLRKMEEEICQTPNGQYQMPLPLRDATPKLPDNKTFAFRRLLKLKSRMENDARYRKDYTAFMKDLIDKGYAERVPQGKLSGRDGNHWYIPHHGVYHPKKPNKIRVVFDCSATYMGHSLNKHLLQGPDLTNSLVGVLCRFRQDVIAFMCDLEAMFHQFKVAEKDRNFLRFYWWENGDTSKAPVEFRMTVHLFGAASSPGCANFGLKKAANDHEDECGSEAASFIRNDFYVDDGLKSVATVSQATSLIQSTKSICEKGGMRHHKFISNSKEVIAKIPPEDRATGVKDLDLQSGVLPIERALGIHWCVESDTFQFRIILQDKPLTRRGILSTVSSVYDPLGFLAPVILTGRQILQSLCRDKSDWDDPVPDPLRQRWERWRDGLCDLDELRIQRCYKPHGFGNLQSVELHHFSDASENGYGQCSYLRLVDDNDQVHCSFVMGKARVTPLKPVTIPRLELTATLLSVKVSAMLRGELEYDEITELFYSDSQVALGYIKNEARRFHVFVANRVQQIRESTTPNQWRYVNTKENPADEASRGLTPKDLVRNSFWLTGPPFLWKRKLCDKCDEGSNFDISPDDPEVKKTQVLTTGTQAVSMATIPERLEYFSDWLRAKKAIAMCVS